MLDGIFPLIVSDLDHVDFSKSELLLRRRFDGRLWMGVIAYAALADLKYETTRRVVGRGGDGDKRRRALFVKDLAEDYIKSQVLLKVDGEHYRQAVIAELLVAVLVAVSDDFYNDELAVIRAGGRPLFGQGDDRDQT